MAYFRQLIAERARHLNLPGRASRSHRLEEGHVKHTLLPLDVPDVLVGRRFNREDLVQGALVPKRIVREGYGENEEDGVDEERVRLLINRMLGPIPGSLSADRQVNVGDLGSYLLRGVPAMPFAKSLSIRITISGFPSSPQPTTKTMSCRSR